MGRELRRVPLDFDWPLHKVWRGYVDPYHRPCPEAAKGRCYGGATGGGAWLAAIARIVAIVGQNAADEARDPGDRPWGRIYPHPYLQRWEQAPRVEMPLEERARLGAIEDERARREAFARYRAEHPPELAPFTPELAELVSGLAGRRPSTRYDDGLAEAIAAALKRAAGVDPDGPWGVCPVCGGAGDDPATRAASEAWEREPPPEGPGYQLWETVSAGSPISPVFPTEDAFVAYLVGEGHGEAAARSFCRLGWAPSMVVDNGGGEPKIYRDIAASERLEGRPPRGDP